jgi:alpha-aminoadipic semialdehyde synthase
MMAVDILPSSIPFDASVHFSSVLLPYLRVLLRKYKGDKSTDSEGSSLEKALKEATIVKKGELVGISTGGIRYAADHTP